MPLVMLPDAVVFPNCPHQFDVFGKSMMAAMRKARYEDKCVFIVYCSDEERSIDLSKRVGVVATRNPGRAGG